MHTKSFATFILLLALLLTFGCTDKQPVPPIPYTTNQFVTKTTDLNTVKFSNGEYSGKIVGIVGNKFSAIDANMDINYTQNLISVSVLPTRATMWHDQSVVTVGTVLQQVTFGGLGQAYFRYAHTSTPANGDTTTNSFLLKAGDYNFYALGFTGNNLGIADFYIDENKIGSWDMYSSSTTYNVIKNFNHTTVNGNGRHVLKIVTNGKNASSASYYLPFTNFWLVSTTDTNEYSTSSSAVDLNGYRTWDNNSFTNIRASGDINGARLFDNNLRVLTSYTDTNWQTSWTLLDANLKATYSPLDLNNLVYQNYNETKDPTGFPFVAGVSINFYDANRYLYVCPTSSSFYYLYKGTKVTVSNCLNVLIPDTNGQLNWVYFNDTTGVLKTTNSVNFAEDAQVATVYWNNGKGFVGTETHGFSMDYTTHGYLHFTVGARYLSGLTGTFNDNNTFSITNGKIYDEDLLHNKATTTNYGRIFYRQPTTLYYNWDNNSTSFFKVNASSVPYYDNAGTLTATTNGYYISYWVFSSPDDNNPIISLMGQRQDTSLSNAQANQTYESLALGTLPSPEMKLLYRVILRYQGGATTVQNVTDYRTVSNLPSGTYTATSHASLTSLNWASSGHYFDTNLNVGGYDINASSVSTGAVLNDVNQEWGMRLCADGNIVVGYLGGYTC